MSYVIYKRDDDGDWMPWTTKTFPDAKGAPTSFASEKDAVSYAERNIGYDWNVRPRGAGYSRSQPQHPKPPSRSKQKASLERMAADMKRQGYVSGGGIESGGEYRWEIQFPSKKNAQRFAHAVLRPDIATAVDAELARMPSPSNEIRSLNVRDDIVELTTSPNRWPGTVFERELAAFNGKHHYSR